MYNFKHLSIPALVAALPVFAFAQYPAESYLLTDGGKTLMSWTGDETAIDMNSDPVLAQVTAIDVNAFRGKGIQSVIVGDNVATISRFAFMDCTSLTEVSLPSTLTDLQNAVFSGCTALTNVEIPAGIKSLSNSLFYGCTALLKVTLPAGLTEIGSGTFSDCASLTGIDIPEGVETIGDEAFSACAAITGIVLPNSLTTIGSGAFEDTRRLEHVTFGRNINEFGSSAFSGSGIVSADMSVLQDEVKYYANCFENCIRLAEISLPEHVGFTGNGMFTGCSALKSATIPDTWDNIPAKMFQSCTGLVSIDMGKGVTSIKNTAFFGCLSLRDICWSPVLNTIDWNVFFECNAIAEIILPESVERIDDYAFCSMASLARVSLGSKINAIGQECFSMNHALTTFEISAATPPALGSYCFYKSPVENATLFVPESAVESYRTAAQWSDFGAVTALSSGIDYITVESAQGVTYDLSGRQSVNPSKGNIIIRKGKKIRL